MIKVQNNIPTREALPQFLIGLRPESLLDLSWTDPALNVQDCAWWPEEYQDDPIDTATHKYGAEILTIDSERKVVVVSHEVVALTQEEIDAARKAITPYEITNWQCKKQLLLDGKYDTVDAAIVGMGVDAKVDWEHAAVFKRDYPLILGMQQLLSQTDADVDEFFIKAAKL